jgi:hypothetical protein
VSRSSRRPLAGRQAATADREVFVESSFIASTAVPYARRAVLILGVPSALVGCGGGPDTNLTIEVANGFGQQQYRLKCDPEGGDVPRPKELCALLADNADVMLFRAPHRSTCIGGLSTVHLRVHGDFDTRKVDATEIDACQGNGEAERLWLSQLPPQLNSS